MAPFSRVARVVGKIARVQMKAGAKPAVYQIDYSTWYARIAGRL